jgi:uncharacterized repeat protein (TIGR02543 family)
MTVKIVGSAKSRKFAVSVSVLALLGTIFSVSAQADDDRKKKDDRSKRVIELANPSGVVITPSSTSLTITFNRVPNASSYTVRVYQGTSGERLVGQPRTMFNPGNSVTGLTPSTDYRVSVQAIGDKTRYSNSDDPRKFRTRTTAVNTPFSITWNSNCPDALLCTPASGGQNFYISGDSIAAAVLPSQPGWSFTNWLSDNPNVSATFPSTPQSPFGNVTFTAQRSLVSYNVTWNLACPTGAVCTPGTGGTAVYTAGQAITPQSTPSRSGFTFKEWLSSNTAVASTASSTPLSPYGNLTFTAEWTANVVPPAPDPVTPGGDGLSEATAGTSAFQIKRDFPASTDGLYWVKNSNINSGQPFKIYADMVTDGGGWTLLVANSSQSWTYAQAQKVNETNPPSNPNNLSALGGKYSILEFGDYIKRASSGFQYRMDAVNPGTCGGIWTANSAYSFVSASKNNINITLNIKWGDWNYNPSGIEERMPCLVESAQALLTTSLDNSSDWWGTLIQADTWEAPGLITVPWIASLSGCDRPNIIWYWVR